MFKYNFKRFNKFFVNYFINFKNKPKAHSKDKILKNVSKRRILLLILLDIYVRIKSNKFSVEDFMHDKVLGAELPSAMALAYLGDARHSLYVRRMLVERGISKSGELNEQALSYVTASSQAKAMRKIESMLLEDEREVYKRAANSGHLNKPKNASASDYRAATGLEAVIGMLTYLGDEDRIEELLGAAYSDTAEEKQ